MIKQKLLEYDFTRDIFGVLKIQKEIMRFFKKVLFITFIFFI